MATIKAFTDIEQSRKLAEILPLESADMFCADVFNKEKEMHSYNFHILSTWGCNTFEELKNRENKFVCFIPVWSLTALLNILPNGIVMNKDSQNGKYHFSSKYIGTYVTADNPVDACVAMIEKLHEQKIL